MKKPRHHVSHIQTEETRKKLSEKMSGENNPMYGRKQTPETKEKIRLALLGKKKSKETCEKMSIAQQGHIGYWKDKKFTEEHRSKLSISHTGLHHDEETKLKIGKALIGHRVVQLVVDNLAAYARSRKGIPKGTPSWEHRINIKNAMDKFFYYKRLVKLLTIAKEIKELYGINMGLNSAYKQWHKPLAEGKTPFHLGNYRPRLHPEKCLTIGNNFFRSSWEARFFEWCDACPDVVKWASEPIAIKYRHPTANLEYCVKHGLDPNDPRFQKILNYYTDVWIELKYMESGEEHTKRVFIEIKPYSLSVPPAPLPPNATLKLHKAYNKAAETYLINKAKWDAARRFCEERGCEFWVVTERELKKKFGIKLD